MSSIPSLPDQGFSLPLGGDELRYATPVTLLYKTSGVEVSVIRPADRPQLRVDLDLGEEGRVARRMIVCS